jgi:hypothetical protein
MSHLCDVPMNIKKNCMSSRHHRSDWQYGQPFPSAQFPDEDFSELFEQQMKFHVDPIDCNEKAIIVGIQGTGKEFEKNYRELDDGNNGIHVFEKKKQKINSAIKYIVKYDNNEKWTCTCEHFEHHRESCCKHINACIDAILWEKGKNILVEERGLKWQAYKTKYEFVNISSENNYYPGYIDIVKKIEIHENAESQFHQFVSSYSHHNFVKIDLENNSTNYHSFNK